MCATEAERCSNLQHDLELLRRVFARRATRGSAVKLTAEERKRLDGLGYSSGGDDDR